jgi:hypothetical protein
VEKIVDYFDALSKRNPIFPLVNPDRILIGTLTPYLSIDNLITFAVAKSKAGSSRGSSFLRAFHSFV